MSPSKNRPAPGTVCQTLTHTGRIFSTYLHNGKFYAVLRFDDGSGTVLAVNELVIKNG